MLLENVFVEYLHGVKYTGGRLACDPAPEARPSRSLLVHLRAAFWSPIVIACAATSVSAQVPAKESVPAPVRDSVPVRRDSTFRIDTLSRRPGLRIPVMRDTLPVHLPTVLSSAERESYRQAVKQIEAATE